MKVSEQIVKTIDERFAVIKEQRAEDLKEFEQEKADMLFYARMSGLFAAATDLALEHIRNMEAAQENTQPETGVFH